MPWWRARRVPRCTKTTEIVPTSSRRPIIAVSTCSLALIPPRGLTVGHRAHPVRRPRSRFGRSLVLVLLRVVLVGRGRQQLFPDCLHFFQLRHRFFRPPDFLCRNGLRTSFASLVLLRSQNPGQDLPPLGSFQDNRAIAQLRLEKTGCLLENPVVRQPLSWENCRKNQ